MISVTPICLAAGAIMMYVYNSYYLHCDTRSVESQSVIYTCYMLYFLNCFRVSGLVVLSFEAPVLCFKIEAIAKLSKWIEDHLRFWIRAFIYFR